MAGDLSEHYRAIMKRAITAILKNDIYELKNAFLSFGKPTEKIDHAAGFTPTANLVVRGLYPFSPERETFCKLSLCGSFEFLSLYKKDLSMEVFFFWFRMKEVH